MTDDDHHGSDLTLRLVVEAPGWLESDKAVTSVAAFGFLFPMMMKRCIMVYLPDISGRPYPACVWQLGAHAPAIHGDLLTK